MRISSVVLVASLSTLGFGNELSAQTCTGLCLQQTTCAAGATTSLSGVVYTPNGTEPLPNVLVYVPNAAVDPFVPGVSCPVVGQPPSGSPLVGATTAVDGSFTIPNMPVGANIPLVIQSGRWRRQLTIPNVASCVDTPFSANMPKNQTEGDIPKIAINTGSADSVECVLHKIGIDNSEFTNPGQGGRINFFTASGGPGAKIKPASPSDPGTPGESVLMGDPAMLNSYDVLMLPCEGGPSTKPQKELQNLIAFANAGGRVYSSHYSYVWMFQNPPFDKVANWTGRSSSLLSDSVAYPATVDTSFSVGLTLSQWLQLVHASTTPGQIPIMTLRQDLVGVNKPTQSWLTLNNLSLGNPVMQFVFDTPVGATTNQCGRVLFNEYHVENSGGGGGLYPSECNTTVALNPQEKLLEYSLFELTNDGGAASLTPAAQDFGTQAVGFNSPTQTFVWTNHSTFIASVTLLKADGDFNVVGNNCSGVPAGGSCQINVVFNPTVVGPRTGTLTVGSTGTTLLSALTGIGIPDLVLSSTALDFGTLDVSASATKTINVTNSASGSVPAPVLITTGDYSASSNCGTTVAASATCVISVKFTPAATGPRAGTVAIQSTNPGTPTTLTGNGVDFTVAISPASGSVIAGYGTQTTVTTSPLAGFAAPVTLSCTTNAPGSTCTVGGSTFTPTAPISTTIAITTVAKYTVIGYGGFGGGGWLSLLALGSGLALWRKRRATVMRAALTIVFLAAAGLSLTGCSGKLPAQNPVYTPAGAYTYTLTATDGFLVHATTFALNVTVK